MAWFIDNTAEVLLTLGIIALIIEVAIMGFATFFLTFIGLALIVTAGAIFIGIIPATSVAVIVCLVITTSLMALVLWKPMRRMQNNVDNTPVKSDLVGYQFTAPGDICNKHTEAPVYRYSGIDWRLVSNEPIAAGEKVEITQADVGVLTVSKSHQ